MRGVVVAIFLAACSTANAPPVQAPQATESLRALEGSVDLDGVSLGAADAPATIVISFASWCEHCHDELRALADVRAAHPTVRIVGLDYRGHEDFAGRGGAAALRAFVDAHAAWLRVVPADDALFAAFGRPPKVPTLFVFDRAGALAATYDLRTRPSPSAAELDQLLARLGA